MNDWFTVEEIDTSHQCIKKGNVISRAESNQPHNIKQNITSA